MSTPPPPFDEATFEADLPPALVEAMRQADTPPAVPVDLDARVMRDAQRHLRSRMRGRNVLLRIGGPLAAAALLGFAFLLYRSPGPAGPSTTQTKSPRAGSALVALPGDLDANGTVNIVDAYLLALELQPQAAADARPAANLDINQDGRVDASDVDALAQQAVKLQ